MNNKLTIVLLLIILIALSLGLGVMIGQSIMINRAHAQNQITANKMLEEQAMVNGQE